MWLDPAFFITFAEDPAFIDIRVDLEGWQQKSNISAAKSCRRSVARRCITDATQKGHAP
jgi:hypothetical protein